jgi:hypothetical protein
MENVMTKDSLFLAKGEHFYKLSDNEFNQNGKAFLSGLNAFERKAIVISSD